MKMYCSVSMGVLRGGKCKILSVSLCICIYDFAICYCVRNANTTYLIDIFINILA